MMCRFSTHAVLCGVAVLMLSAGGFPHAEANDSMAELDNSGLVLITSDDVEMRSEDLYISMDEVRVRYVFYNRSDEDITTLVAFPMPDIAGEPYGVGPALPSDNPVNLMNFTVSADGRSVAPQVEQRVRAAGIDRTAFLDQHGIPLAPHLLSTKDRLTALSPEVQADLVRYGMVHKNEFDEGQGRVVQLTPVWTLSTTFYWEQTFPAGQEVVVEHRYQPSVGATAGVVFLDYQTAEPDPVLFPEYVQKYCIEPSFTRAVQTHHQAGGGFPFTESYVAYVLRTGANWAGAIGQFRLVVDKGSTDNLVSFCGEGVTKIAPTQFEMVKEDFWPERDLNVLFVVRHPR